MLTLKFNKMKTIFFLPMMLFGFLALGQNVESEKANPSTYLSDLKKEMQVEWPENRTINIVFHGHSVPSGYFKTPEVNTLAAYPALVLKIIKTQYPYAVVNVINTSIGGENSISGAKRFDHEVLNHQPDVILSTMH